MTSAHQRSSGGSQGGIALILAIAAFAISVFLWAGTRTETALPDATPPTMAATPAQAR